MAFRLRPILPDDANALRRSNVVPGLPIDLVGGVEVLLDQLLASGKAVAATHDRTLERLFLDLVFYRTRNDSVTGSKIEGQAIEGVSITSPLKLPHRYQRARL